MKEETPEQKHDERRLEDAEKAYHSLKLFCCDSPPFVAGMTQRVRDDLRDLCCAVIKTLNNTVGKHT